MSPTIQLTNPATGKARESYPCLDYEEGAKIVEKLHEGFLEWKATDFATRSSVLSKIGKLLIENKESLAKRVAEEMGKPISQGMGEVELCLAACDYYSKNAEELLKDRIVQTDLSKSYVSYCPLGVIYTIQPWNYPIWQVIRIAIPTLAAGNACLLKHAPISTGTALALQKIFHEAGVPKNVFRVLIATDQDAEKLVHHPKVALVTLTGSCNAGRAIASASGKALKKTILELGGNDPWLILDDADLDLAAKATVNARMNNAGQVCTSPKRILVMDSVFDSFKEKVLKLLDSFQMGDPLNQETKLGPLSRKDIRDQVHKQVEESVKKGATLISGGEIPDKPGFYYPATVLTDVKKGTPAFDEEIFGPVVTLIRVKSLNEAIELANDSSFGLSAAIFSKNEAEAEKIAAEKIEAGSCGINTGMGADPRLPFGGIKNSGYGREQGIEGILSLVNEKTICIR